MAQTADHDPLAARNRMRALRRATDEEARAREAAFAAKMTPRAVYYRGRSTARARMRIMRVTNAYAHDGVIDVATFVRAVAREVRLLREDMSLITSAPHGRYASWLTAYVRGQYDVYRDELAWWMS